MPPMSHQRYGCWSAQAPPPLPLKRMGPYGSQLPTTMEGSKPSVRKTQGGKTNVLSGNKPVLAQPQLPPEATVADPRVADDISSAGLVVIPLAGDGGAGARAELYPALSMEPNFKVGELCFPTRAPKSKTKMEGADPKAMQEVVKDPSKWILRNFETGQELNARAFVEAVMMISTPRQNPFNATNPRDNSRHLPLGGTWGGRRRSNRSTVRRPTLLPQDSIGLSENFSTSHSFRFGPAGSRSPRSGVSPGSSCHGASSLQNLSIRTSISSMSGAADRSFRLSRVRPAQVLRDLHAGGIRTMRFSPSGDYFATAGADNRALVFRVIRRRDGSVEGPPQRMGAAGLLSLLGCTADGESVKGESFRNLADVQSDRILRLVEEVPFRTLLGHVGEVVSLSWAPDDSALLTASADGTVRCWRPQEGDDCTAVYEHGGRVTAVAWEPAAPMPAAAPGVQRGGRFLTGCMDGKLRIFSAGNVEPDIEVLAERPVTAIAFSPGGASFAAGLVGGSVRFYRTAGMVQEHGAECRRHGIRHSASNMKPVKRLSVGTGNQTKGNGIARRKNTSASVAVGSGTAEERVTGLCFRPIARALGDGEARSTVESPNKDPERRSSNSSSQGLVESNVEELPFVMSPTTSTNEERQSDEHETSTGDDRVQKRAPAFTIIKPRADSITSRDGKENDNVWVRPKADVLVSTNDSRVRVLEPGRSGKATVRLKLKGHNTEGVLGRHAVAAYSDDGEFIISGSADGYVHVWPASLTRSYATQKRTVAWNNNKEGHERVLVCGGKVAVPSALFAPDNVAQSIGGEAGRVIVTGDAEGSVKVFVG